MLILSSKRTRHLSGCRVRLSCEPFQTGQPVIYIDVLSTVWQKIPDRGAGTPPLSGVTEKQRNMKFRRGLFLRPDVVFGKNHFLYSLIRTKQTAEEYVIGRAESGIESINLQRLKEAILRDEEFGGRKTQEEYAAELQVSPRTISRYYRELNIRADNETERRPDSDE